MPLNLTIREELAKKFKAYARKERRPQNAQMEIILEEFFNRVGKDGKHGPGHSRYGRLTDKDD